MLVLEGEPLDIPEERPIALLERAVACGGGYKIPDGDDFRFMPWSDVLELVQRVAGGLVAAGFGPGTKVAIFSETRYEWKIVDQAVQWMGGVVVPMYPTLMHDQVAHIMADSGAEVGFVENQELLGRVPEGTWYSFDDSDAPSWQELHGDPVPKADVGLDEPCSIVYTSGTTGAPKGAVLTHRNWTASNAGNVRGLALDEHPEATMLAFLPMAHVAGYASVLAVTALGGTVAFSHPSRIATDFPLVRPDLLVAVPRIYERIMTKVEERVAGGPKIRQFLFARAKSVAIKTGARLEQGRRPAFGHWLFERLVYRKLRVTLGFDRVEVALTGAAAVRPSLLYFFQGIGVNIVEAYGLTECAGLLVSNGFDDFRAGTVGKVMPGSRLALAEDGEILLAGPTIFQGYLTGETDCLVDGWLRTGDIGELRDGFLAIIDRKKEIEVLDTGKNIAPTHAEELLKASPLVDEVCVIGQGRKFAAALIQPNFGLLRSKLEALGATLNGRVQADPTGAETLVEVDEAGLEDSRIKAWIQEAVDRMNERLPDYERIRSFRLVPTAFTVERDELTPTFKKKRRNILANHKARIEAMFQR
ncbi:MAG: AMP-dependent synthetase/ligase [Thermoplasmatota archaeon]